jgi:Ribonuclease H2 non-catalytic subunit (Ylr154p-like)
MTLNFSEPPLKEIKHLYFIPCVIKKTQPAQVDKYFTSNIAQKDSLVVSMFGRALKGKECQIPPNYKGVMCKHNKAYQEFDPEARFHSLTYFKHESEPTSSDPIPVTLKFCEYLETIHSIN